MENNPSSKPIPLLLQSLGRGIYPLPNPSPLAAAAGLLAGWSQWATLLAILSLSRRVQERPRWLQERYDSVQDASKSVQDAAKRVQELPSCLQELQDALKTTPGT